MADYYFTKEEQELIKKLYFDYSIFETLKKSILEEINHLRDLLPERFAERLIASYSHTIEPLNYFKGEITSTPSMGISIPGTVIENPQQFIENLNSKIREKDYFAFLSDSTIEPNYYDQVAIIKARDQLEIFTLLPTPFKHIISNPHYHVKNEEIVLKLKDWDKRFGIKILGVGYNWIELKFMRLPEDMDNLVEEIRELSPDAFGWWEEETAEEEEQKVVERLKKEGTIYCWWEE